MYKLLIVDDENLEREGLKYIIGQSHLNCLCIEEAGDGLSAIEVAKSFRPDIAILDIKMPGLDGLQVGHILKTKNPDIKIIFMTAFDSFEYAHEAIKIGVEDFLVKPASKSKTIQILEVCIEKLNKNQRLIKQKENLEVKLSQVSHYLEHEFVNSVVNGEIDEQDADEYLKFMVNEFVVGFGVVVDLDEAVTAERSKSLHQKMVYKRFAAKISILLSKNMKCLISQHKQTIYIFVFNYDQESYLNILQMIDNEIQLVHEEMGEQLGVHITYGIGEPYSNIAELWKSFAQGKVAARSMGMDRLDTDGDECVRLSGTDFKEDKLCFCIFKGNEEEMIRSADAILDAIIYANNDMNAIRLHLYEFFVSLNRYLNKESQIKHAVPEYIFDDLNNIENQGEAKRYMHRYLYGIVEEIEIQKNHKELQGLDKAIAYIESHYSTSVTLEDVAYEIGFSTYYFGKMFKKRYQLSFTDYLTRFRIAKAKELLRIERLPVKDITYRVGYMDPNYFTRVFKKLEGITPTEYRGQFGETE